MRHRLQLIWRDVDGLDPRVHGKKIVAYHNWLDSVKVPLVFVISAVLVMFRTKNMFSSIAVVSRRVISVPSMQTYLSVCMI